MFKRILKFIVACLLLPVFAACLHSFWQLLLRLPALGHSGLFFGLGAAIYVVCYVFSLKLSFLYVFGHETTHALAVLLCGGQIKGFNVSGKGGSVTTTKTNTLISLSPYCLPFYVLIVGGIFLVSAIFYPEIRAFADAFILAAGFGLSLHFFMTMDSLRVEQTDLTQNGYFFSGVLMCVCNVVMLAVVLGVIFPEAGLKLFFKETFTYSRHYAYLILRAGVSLAGTLSNKF